MGVAMLTGIVCAGGGVAQAQYVTNYVDGVTNTAVDLATFAANTANNALIIQNGGWLQSDYGIVAWGATPASNNLAVITGAGSTWTATNNLTVGNGSSYNQMLISAGGVVANSNGFIGWIGLEGSNAVTVTDWNSQWNNSGALSIGGNNQSGNQLLASNYAVVTSDSGAIGFGGGHNAALITDGAVWSNRTDLVIGPVGLSGSRGFYNSLTVANGGRFVGSNTIVGQSYDASSNSILVTGTGSTMLNSGSLVIGDTLSYAAGTGNSLTIANAGAVSAHDAIIGNGASSNSALVTDASSQWNITSNLFVGVGGSGNALTIAAGGQVLVGVGQVPIVPATFSTVSMGANAGDQNNAILVTNAGSLLQANVINVGAQGSGNALSISDGGHVTVSDLVQGFGPFLTRTYGVVNVGQAADANHNSLTVDGSSSLLQIAAPALNIGNQGSSNTLQVSGGAQIVVTDSQVKLGNWVTLLSAVNIGAAAAAGGNRAVITDAGSLVKASIVDVGADGSGNSLTIAHGGTVSSSYGIIGSNSMASGNAVLLTGAGSLWSNTSLLAIGGAGSNNQMTVSDGATVGGNGSIVVGVTSNSAHNSLLITGAGSSVNGWQLLVGNGGYGNTMTLSAGGVANAAGGIGGSNSSVLVTDAGSAWNTPDLTIGGSGGLLQIVNGGVVSGSNSTLAGYRGLVAISGVNSMLTNSGDLTVGHGGSNNGLLLTNRGTASSANGYLGVTHLVFEGQGDTDYGTTVYPFKGIDIGVWAGSGLSSSNSAVVTGNGTVWNVSTNLSVGRRASSDNTLTIANGGTVNSLNGFVGDTGWGETNIAGMTFYVYADNNAATVTGSGSVWNNTGDLTIGHLYASGNSLTIANQGTVNSAQGYLGVQNASNNSVLVTGAGSSWNVAGGTIVGSNGVGNTLTIANGGVVNNGSEIEIGVEANAHNNSVSVTGAGSTWTNPGFNVGSLGSSNSLTISAGGVVNSLRACLGAGAISAGNKLTVDGGVLTGTDVLVGGLGHGNNLTISNGGVVSMTLSSLQYGVIGQGASASNNTVLVTGAGSVWEMGKDLKVGSQGSGNTLAINAGGKVTVGSNLHISAQSGANGNAVNITDGTLTVSNGTIMVGTAGGSGAFNLDGGLVYADKLVANSGHDSAATFTKGYMDLLQATVEKESALVVGDGTQTAHLNLRGGVSSFADGLTVANNSIVTGSGSTTNGDVLIQNGGTLSPGNGSTLGTFSFSGKLTLNGTLDITLDNAAGTFGTGDFVAVSALLDLNGGIIDFSLLNAPVNEVYVFSSYGSLTGTLSATNNVPDGYIFETNYAGNELALVMIPEPVTAGLLFLFGGGALIFRRMRRWKSW
jgi:T5SS/PEP-CTERM-associated repeat protein